MDYEAFKDVLSRQRAIRLFDTSRDVDDATVEDLIRVATWAPNGGNRQGWRFIVIRNRDTRQKLGAIFDELGRNRPDPAPERTPWEDVPVLVAVCAAQTAGVNVEGQAEVGRTNTHASVYPAVQNFLLAAHAAGLGSVLTTRWMMRGDEVKSLLGIKDNELEVMAILPLGWSDRKYGRGKRLPVSEVTYREKAGQPW